MASAAAGAAIIFGARAAAQLLRRRRRAAGGAASRAAAAHADDAGGRPGLPRLGRGADPGSPTYDAVLAALPPADDADAMAAFVQANRDLLDYRFLYRMTAQLLSVENRGGERGEPLRAQREGVVRAAQRFDAPLFKQIAEAEGRLGQLLAQNMQAAGKKGKKKRSDAASVVLAAGGQPIQIFAFWLVVVAAMAAWESKLATPSTSAMAQAKIAELAEVRDALEGRDSLVEAGALGELLPLLQLADVRSGVSGPAYRPPDSLAQLVAETLPKGEEDSLKVVRRLGCLSCQLQRHAFQAYNHAGAEGDRAVRRVAVRRAAALRRAAHRPRRRGAARAQPDVEPDPPRVRRRLARAPAANLLVSARGPPPGWAALGRTVNTNTHILQPRGVQNALHCTALCRRAHTSPRGRHIGSMHNHRACAPTSTVLCPLALPLQLVRPLLLSPPLFRPVTNHFKAFTRRTSASRRGTRRSDRRGSLSRWPIPTSRRP